MSDTSQGPGWWMASDGKFYPPADAPPPAPPPLPPTDAPPPLPPPGGYAPNPYPPSPYPQAPAPGYGAGGTVYVPVPQKSGSNGCLIAVAVVVGVIVLLGLVAAAILALVVDEASDQLANIDVDREQMRGIIDETGISTSSTNTENPPQYDLDDFECDLSDAPVRASGELTNNSSEESDYWITVAFESDDGLRIDTSTNFVSNVRPDESAEWEVTGLVSGSQAEDITECRVSTIERWSSGMFNEKDFGQFSEVGEFGGEIGG